MDDLLLNRRDAALAVGVKPRILSVWKYRRLISTTEAGLYRLGDVLEVERRTRRTVMSRGGHSRTLEG